MIIVAAAAPAGSEAPRRALPGAASRRAKVSAAIAGASNAHSPGSIRFRRLTIRYKRRIDIHGALTSIACSLIAFRTLEGRL
jgi:hypothetical protein